MKQVLLSIVLVLFSISCNGIDDVYKNTVVNYLQTEKGMKTDFKIEFQKFELSNITVADSTRILLEQYQAEKQKKIESAQQSISHWESSIEKHQKKGSSLVAKALVGSSQKELENAKTKLEQAEQWEPDYIHQYANRNSTEIIAKKVDTYFSFQNPQLAQPVRQELGAIFILSPDGTKCHKIIKLK